MSVAYFCFSIVVVPREGNSRSKDLKINIESIVKNQGFSWKKISIESTLLSDEVEEVERIFQVAKNIYNIFVNIKNLNFNDGCSLNISKAPPKNIERSLNDVVKIGGANISVEGLEGLNIKIDTTIGAFEAMPNRLLGNFNSRVKASYSPVGNDASWARDGLALRFDAESRNSYFRIDAIKKLTNIFASMMRQNVFGILPSMPDVEYSLLALRVRDNLPVCDSTKESLAGVFSYLGPNANVHDFCNYLNEGAIASYTSPVIRNNTAMMCKLLATLRAGLLTLALARGKVIRMYDRGFYPLPADLRQLPPTEPPPTINIYSQNHEYIVLSGTGQAGAAISIYKNHKLLVGAPIEVDSDGHWVCNDIVLQKNGAYSIYCKQKDLVGRVSESSIVRITIDHPVADPIIIPEVIISEDCQIIKGTGQPLASISLHANGHKLDGSTNVRNDGSWEFQTKSVLKNGKHDIFATQECVHDFKKSNVVQITIDHPVRELIIIQPDGIISDNYNINGTGEPRSLISLYANGHKLDGSTNVRNDGAWEFQINSVLKNGKHDIFATQECVHDSRKSKSIQVQVFVPPGHPSEIKEAFKEGEYIDDLVLLKASIRYILDSLQIVTIGNFWDASVEKVLAIGEENYDYIITMLKYEADKLISKDIK